MRLEDEQIVLVNQKGEPIGQANKLASHHADTPLHLAFSCYIFNDQGQFLVTQRAAHKKVWPDVLTNSCCGHPAPGESLEAAIRRRVNYELGMTVTDLAVMVADYTYKTTPYNGIIDHEFCPIYIARASSAVVPNPDEVSQYQWLSWGNYVQQAQADTNDTWSWWCKDQLKLLEHHPLILQYASSV